MAPLSCISLVFYTYPALSAQGEGHRCRLRRDLGRRGLAAADLEGCAHRLAVGHYRSRRSL
jgi:hypothetical protein